MPFNTIPAKDFFNRESEFNYLRLLAHFRESAVAANVLLEGARGIGKTELLKQLFRTIFWEEKNVIPFYYSFTRATLKAPNFARDYFMRFVRQYIAYLKKDPSLTNTMTTSLKRLIPIISSLGVYWMIDLIEEFHELSCSGDVYGQIMGAIAAPVTAAGKTGVPVLIMLDDFHVAAQLYEMEPGDAPGLMSLFEGSMKNYLCPHILTGSPEEVLESIFTDNSFRGTAERMFLGPLAEDIALSLFSSLCEKLAIRGEKDTSLRFMKFLGGNPLYIRNIAKALWKMQKRNYTERDLWESYAYEISEGETAFYWSSVFGEFMRDPDHRRAAIELVVHSIKTNGEIHNLGRLSKVLRLSESSLRNALDAMQKAGIIQSGRGSRQIRDNILQDFMHVLYMREIEGMTAENAREHIMSRHQPLSDGSTCFEMVIPMASNAELVAAKAVEQICKSINLGPGLINQIQLALIESCINAMEHSGSYEKRIFLKVTASDERLELSIESPGKPFDAIKEDGRSVEERILSSDKRGWGLDLMRKIMDEVKVERIEDRTRVILIKNIKNDEVLK